MDRDPAATLHPPAGHIAVTIPKAVLLLTVEEYARGIRRGKWWRRRQAMLKRETARQEGTP
jgi:hypothetical protein